MKLEKRFDRVRRYTKAFYPLTWGEVQLRGMMLQKGVVK